MQAEDTCRFVTATLLMSSSARCLGPGISVSVSLFHACNIEERSCSAVYLDGYSHSRWTMTLWIVLEVSTKVAESGFERDGFDSSPSRLLLSERVPLLCDETR